MSLDLFELSKINYGVNVHILKHTVSVQKVPICTLRLDVIQSIQVRRERI